MGDYQLQYCCDGSYFIFSEYDNEFGPLILGDTYYFDYDGVNIVCATIVPYSGLGPTFIFTGIGNPVRMPN